MILNDNFATGVKFTVAPVKNPATGKNYAAMITSNDFHVLETTEQEIKACTIQPVNSVFNRQFIVKDDGENPKFSVL